MKLKLLCILGVLIGSLLISGTVLAQENGPPAVHQIIQEYEGAKTCAQCHRAIPQQVAETMHYTWLDAVQYVAGYEKDLTDMLSSFYGLPASVTGINWLGLLQPADASKPPQPDGCAQCHIGFGTLPNAPDALTQDDYDNIDCLICHGLDYTRTVANVAGDIKLAPVKGIDAVEVARNAQLPTSETCMRCHLSSGGGPNYNHGDSPTSPDVDVHVAAGLECTDCHQVKAHRFGGSSTDMQAVDQADLMLNCTNCHDGQHFGEAAPINGHLERVACQTCHIPAIARDPDYPTVVQTDWTQSQLTETGLYAPVKQLLNDVTPVYRWWNSIVQTDSPDASGSIDDTDAKINPWKYAESIVPVDAENRVNLPLNITTFSITGDLEQAITQGSASSGIDYSGEWEAMTVQQHFSLNHQVAPANKALHCVDCHTEQGRIDFAALGYNEERVNFLSKLAQPGALDEPPHQYLSRYDGPSTCLSCHPEAGMQVAQSIHYSWLGVAQNVVDGEITLIGMGSEYCGLPASVTGINWLGLLQPQDTSKPPQSGGCAQCHVGFGPKPNPPDALTEEDYRNVDCLICHGSDYRRTVVKVGDKVQIVPAEDVNIINVVQNVSLPTNETCLRCHLGSGGGPNYKHGVAPTADSGDVHIEAGLQCIDCHKVENHRFGGSADLKGVDRPDVSVSCTDCHAKDHPIGFLAIDLHQDRVACQTCHIPAIAQDLNYPTLVHKDWTQAVLEESGLYAPQMTLATNVMPTYRWWNGLVRNYPPEPMGSIEDEGAKLYPWKYITSVVPVDAKSKDFLPIKAGTYFITGNLDEAVANGAEMLAVDYSGTWEAETDELYFSLNHQVQPADKALHCPDCHTLDLGRLDFPALGYADDRAAGLMRVSSSAASASQQPFGDAAVAQQLLEDKNFALTQENDELSDDKSRNLVLGILAGILVGLVFAIALMILVLRRRGITNKRVFTWLTQRRTSIFGLAVLVLGSAIVGFLAIHYTFEFTASADFCMDYCHATEAEHITYQTSLHANLECAECHVGPGLDNEIKAKLNGLRELALYVTDSWERPIASPVETLRPAREVCEHCHWPEMFYADRAVEIPQFANDETNSRSSTYMLLKIGGGTERLGQGQGIHWHIQNKVEYIATDPQHQNIPWVRAELNGEVITFVDAKNPMSEEELAEFEIREMDCIDCHNRASHIFRSTNTLLDEAMANGRLPTDLPFLRREAEEIMEAHFEYDIAIEKLEAIPDFYRENYPEIYKAKQDVLAYVVQVLKDLYAISHFPEQEVDHTTYPDNLAHSEFPGCFRCHDGNHYKVDDGDQSIRLHCNICHSIPETVTDKQPVPEMPFVQNWQPDNHLSSTWMADHRFTFDQTCIGCHEEETFCANANCHGRSWPYVDLSARVSPFPLPSE